MGSGFQRILDFFASKAGLSLGAVIAAVAIAGGGFWAGRATAPMPHAANIADSSDLEADTDDTLAPEPAANLPPQPVHRAVSHRGEVEGAAVIASATKTSGTRFVHRNNSDLRKEPSYASETLKKEPKGAQVQMVALSDKWAEVQDGAVKGWMRASVLKDTPPDAPGAKHPRKKKAGDGD
jgi:hypothetical protein